MSDEAENFNPKSHNAMFATILQRLEEQDRSSEAWRLHVAAVLDQIKTETTKTNGRVTGLEGWRTTFKAQVALLIILGSGIATLLGWAVGVYLSVK